MPVPGMIGRESPANSLCRNTILYMTVFGYVKVVVVIGEIAIIDLPVNGNDSYRQNGAYQ
jgi:hypothetical protein